MFTKRSDIGAGGIDDRLRAIEIAFAGLEDRLMLKVGGVAMLAGAVGGALGSGVIPQIVRSFVLK